MADHCPDRPGSASLVKRVDGRQIVRRARPYRPAIRKRIAAHELGQVQRVPRPGPGIAKFLVEVGYPKQKRERGQVLRHSFFAAHSRQSRFHDSTRVAATAVLLFRLDTANAVNANPGDTDRDRPGNDVEAADGAFSHIELDQRFTILETLGPDFRVLISSRHAGSANP